ncbi:MAG: hypothetical protein HY926_02485 [Elusimicrobia bacterium]|nr:hypothetical protein [Elusimicrobiota bacterium]
MSMKAAARLSTKALAILLAQLIAAQSATAAVQAVQVRAGALPVGAPAAVGAAALGSLSAPAGLSLQAASLKGLTALPLAAVPAVVFGQVSAAAPVLAAPAASSSDKGVPVAQAVQTLSEKRIQPAVQAAAEAMRGAEQAPADPSKGAAEAQFSVLTGEKRAASSTLAEEPAAAAPVTLSASLKAPEAKAPSARAGVPARSGFTQVFKDPERNKSFWRYVAGYITFLFGFRMYVVGLPYYISGLTKNSLAEANDPRLGDAETVKALVRENRSLARIAHWVAQGLSYATVPLFTKNGAEGPKKWLVRSYFVRFAVLALIPTLFFASGLLSLNAAFLIFFGLVAAQSFFQGLSVTTESAATARIIGDSSVTQAERTKANSILFFISAAMSILGPVLGGQVAAVSELFGKANPGGALIYGIYALVCGVAGLIFASLGIINGRAAAAAPTAGAVGAEKVGLGGTLKNLWVSFKDGLQLVFKNRLLRTLCIVALVSALFADPLIFNVLPEFVEGLIKSDPGGLGSWLQVPVLGWFLKALTGTPMGYFALMTAGASVGSMAASATLKPLRKLFLKLGFKTEESLTIPFYILAALEAPLFWLMIAAPSTWAVLGLYLLQSLLVGYAGITISSFYQKTLGSYEGKDVPKILAAQSLLSIVASIIATYLYGFVLTGIPIATSLLIAAVATTVLSAIRLAAPWLLFSKESRGTKATPIKEA